MRTLYDINITGKRVLIRQDLNVPVTDGRVTSDARILAALPTLQYALQQQAAVLVMSHLGRPAEGHPEPHYSLAPVAKRLSELLGQTVRLASNWLTGVNVAPGELVLCENVRFCTGEKVNDPELAKQMSALCDVYVMDAFGTAHRAQASTEGIIHVAPTAVAGPLLQAELDALEKVLHKPKRPLLAIIGGSKVSTKLNVLNNIMPQVDHLITGGGIANTLLAAAGYPVGKSLYEPDLLDAANDMLASGKIPLPTDVVVGESFSTDTTATVKPITEVGDNDLILDIGLETAADYSRIIHASGTILWNGPVGVFEFPAFANGTRTLSEAVAASDAFSVAGGGDTLAAISQFGVTEGISYQSTGGGAFLEYVEGKTLPAVAALQARNRPSA